MKTLRNRIQQMMHSSKEDFAGSTLVLTEVLVLTWTCKRAAGPQGNCGACIMDSDWATDPASILAPLRIEHHPTPPGKTVLIVKNELGKGYRKMKITGAFLNRDVLLMFD